MPWVHAARILVFPYPARAAERYGDHEPCVLLTVPAAGAKPLAAAKNTWRRVDEDRARRPVDGLHALVDGLHAVRIGPEHERMVFDVVGSKVPGPLTRASAAALTPPVFGERPAMVPQFLRRAASKGGVRVPVGGEHRG